jgi:hypothetical protein
LAKAARRKISISMARSAGRSRAALWFSRGIRMRRISIDQTLSTISILACVRTDPSSHPLHNRGVYGPSSARASRLAPTLESRGVLTPPAPINAQLPDLSAAFRDTVLDTVVMYRTNADAWKPDAFDAQIHSLRNRPGTRRQEILGPLWDIAL